MCMNMLCVNLPFFYNGKIANKSVNRATNSVVTTPKFNTGVQNDVFIRTSPSFGSSTSNGKFLMKLSRIRDPYSGVIILRPNEVDGISSALRKKQSTAGKLHILGEHTESMLPVERGMYSFFCEVNKKNKNLTVSEILRAQYPYSIRGLVSHQNKVFNSIEKASEKISEKNRAKVFNELAEARERILLPEEDFKHKFKRKTFIDRLVRIQCNDILDNVKENIKALPEDKMLNAKKSYSQARYSINNMPHDKYIDNEHRPIDLVRSLQKKYAPDYKDEIGDIIDIAENLPTSSDSMNAFVVKYADRTDQEICDRLIIPSRASVEHIHADSLGGENEAPNFMLATTARNSERGNMPIQEFIKKYPDIPKYSQQYIDDVIREGNKGKLAGYEWYPYLFKDNYKKESGINLDISKYKIKPENAFYSLPPRLRDDYPKYKQYIPDPTEPLNIK